MVLGFKFVHSGVLAATGSCYTLDPVSSAFLKLDSKRNRSHNLNLKLSMITAASGILGSCYGIWLGSCNLMLRLFVNSNQVLYIVRVGGELWRNLPSHSCLEPLFGLREPALHRDGADTP